jgi:hypothetical protein
MLVPLTDSTNAYAAMMLELIRLQGTRQMTAERAGHVTRATRGRRGFRALVAWLNPGRRRAPATSAA